jgi:DNA-binding MarR family transcriptional regulator
MVVTDIQSTALDDPGMRAWVRFLQAHATVARRLEAELQAERDMSLAEYDALLQIAVSEGGRMRMSHLADSLLLSRSGATRLVDRLEGSGCVTRMSCPSDARGSYAALTDVGRARLRDAMPVHLRGVREHFLDRVPADELPGLTRTLERLSTRVPADDARCEAAAGIAGDPAESPTR